MPGKADIVTSSPWVEKYRPTFLKDVVHHERILNVLQYFLQDKHIFPHFFFYGPPGTGKTSTILSCAREIYGTSMNMMVLHLNASDERGVDVVRKQIIQFASTSPMASPSSSSICNEKLVILDEADSMTEQAQVSLRDILVVHNTRFCLIGNCQYSIIPALQSHFIKLVFSPIEKSAAMQMGKTILEKEGMPYSTEALDIIYDVSRGDLRKYINILQAVCIREDGVKSEGVNEMQHDHEYLASTIAFFCSHSLKESLHKMRGVMLENKHDFQSWLSALFQYALESYTGDPNSNELTQFMNDISNIEYNSSSMVYYDIQLVSLVACCHQFFRRRPGH